MARPRKQATALTNVSRAINRLSEQATELASILDQFETDVDLEESVVDGELEALEEQPALEAATDGTESDVFTFVDTDEDRELGGDSTAE